MNEELEEAFAVFKSSNVHATCLALDDSEDIEAHIKSILQELVAQTQWDTIEKLIVERIVLAYLQLHLAEMKLLQSNSESRALQHRVESLNRGYLKALKTLADIRKKKVTVSVEE